MTDSDSDIPTTVWAIPLDDVADLPRLAALVANTDDHTTGKDAR